jgi:subtilisin-like proprotein convertase family protein
MLPPNDPLFAAQDHFPLIGDVLRVWQDHTGRGVRVAVYDDGIERTHADLAANYDASLHFVRSGVTYAPDPLTASDWHGTAVAGVIGAVANNGVGGSGIAPGVALTSVNFLDVIQPEPFAVWLDAYRWGANFDVVNASFGRLPDFRTSLAPQPGTGVYQELLALADIAAQGRGGLGTIVVKSAGNDAMNAQGDGAATSRHLVLVGATDGQGNAAAYSNWSGNLLVTAPGTTLTTDRTGTAGATNGDMVTAAGTSFSAPIVSGVVALMLEANPGLGWRDVKNILAASASQTGSAPGAPAQGFERDAWFSNGGGLWNGGGATFSLAYGYGMVDAYAAVRMAEAWHLLHAAPQTSANEQSATATMSGTRSIPALGTREVPLTVTGNVAIEHIQVSLSIRHGWAPDLVLSLVSPDGVAFPLMLQDGAPSLMTDGWSWTLLVEGARGLTSAGTWTLRIDDVVEQDGGTLTALTLRFLGAAPEAGRVHHLTEDFPELLAWQPGRATLSPGSAEDRLNLSALRGDVSLSLAAGGTLSVDGAAWATLDGRFAQAVLGDGNDVVRGHDFGVVLHGMRGNDLLVGGLGDDALYGGAGKDILVSAGGNNLLDGGAGFDLALMNALRRQGTLEATDEGFTFAKSWGTDTLVSIEAMAFLDGMLLFDADAMAAKVARLYQAALGRLPDPFGISFWTDALSSGGFTLSWMASGFLRSAEFATRFPALDDGGFVTLLYANVLGRDPDAGGFAFHTGRLADGAAREAVLLDFSESAENRDRTAGLLEDGLWVPSRDALTVLRTYATVLDRLPDTGGLAYWIGQLRTGAADYDSMAGGFMGSPEFQSRYGALSNQDFVELLYLNALGRPGKAGGIGFFTERLDSGASTRADVVAAFAFAPEMDARLSPYAADGIAFA